MKLESPRKKQCLGHVAPEDHLDHAARSGSLLLVASSAAVGLIGVRMIALICMFACSVEHQTTSWLYDDSMCTFRAQSDHFGAFLEIAQTSESASVCVGDGLHTKRSLHGPNLASKMGPAMGTHIDPLGPSWGPKLVSKLLNWHIRW